MSGQTIKEKIRSLGKSQREIADLLGVSPQSLTSILSADNVRSGTLERLAEVLSVPVSYFYGETSNGGAVGVVNYGEGGAINNGEVNIGDGERVRYLERLLDEKERTIQILMKR